MIIKKVILVRHAAYDGNGPDPPISDLGKKQAADLAEKIKTHLNGEQVDIWTSTARRARGTAEIIKQEMQLVEMQEFEKLWSDSSHDEDYLWLYRKLDAYEGEALIIVSHFEYVRCFPRLLSFSENEAGYAQGVCIADGRCSDIL